MAHVARWKKETVKQFVSLLADYPIVGIVNMENLPTSQLQVMREQLRETVVMKMTKKRLLKIAMEESKDKVKGIEQLEEFLRGMPALLLTKENPFKLYKTLKKKKTSAPAKAGQIAPKDIVVQQGPTGFAPGPIIGELGSLGIKAGIEGGKVAIKEDAVVLKEGEVFSDKLAGVLSRLGVEPMEIGLDLVAVLEDGTVFKRNILDVDEDEYINNITTLARQSFNLAMEIAYPSADTCVPLIQRAFTNAKNLAMESNILNKDTVNDILAKSYCQMLSLASSLPDEAKSEELKSINTTVATQESNNDKKEEEKEEPKKEENTDAAVGLGSLFG